VQETLAREFRNRRVIGNPEAYLVEAVKQDAKNYAGGLLRDASIGAYLAREAPRPAPIDENVLTTRLMVREALEALPEDIRAAVWAVYAEGVSWRQAAEEAGVSTMTLHDRVEKWLPHLREQLGRTDSPTSRTDSGEDGR
jgi:DNA-directed RNA polymerase specialized sigma24 family protein